MFRHVQINQNNINDNDDFRKLYESSFPPEEKIPYDSFINLHLDFHEFLYRFRKSFYFF